jgi:hypothetical protein
MFEWFRESETKLKKKKKSLGMWIELNIIGKNVYKWKKKTIIVKLTNWKRTKIYILGATPETALSQPQTAGGGPAITPRLFYFFNDFF